MYLLQKATQLTVDRDRLIELYRHPDPIGPTSGCHVRANMVASLDGAATVDGVTASMGGDGDHEIFALLRELCDVVLVGSGTVIGENYRPIPGDDDGDTVPRLAMVSGSLGIDPRNPVVSAPTTVIMTCRGAPEGNRRRLVDAGATLIDCGTDTVELPRVLAALAERGRRRVLCEGGPGLLGDLVAADLLDELCLTVSPMLAVGGAGRITRGDTDGVLRAMRRAHVLADDDGSLFTLWVRDERSDD